jgi:hypothetical protein
MKTTVSKRALIQRINRRIGGYDRKSSTAWGEQLRTNRSERCYGDLGWWYTVDRHSNVITGSISSREALEQYGREVGALAEREEVQL